MRAATLAARLKQCQVKTARACAKSCVTAALRLRGSAMAAASAAGGPPLHGTVATAFLVQENLEHQFLDAAKLWSFT